MPVKWSLEGVFLAQLFISIRFRSSETQRTSMRGAPGKLLVVGYRVSGYCPVGNLSSGV
jgi:hypothetical protein